MGSNGEDFVDQIFNADDAKLTESFLDYLVLVDDDSLSINLTETSLVDQLSDGFKVGVPEGDERLSNTEHFSGGFVDFDEDSIVDLSESEELHDLPGLGGDVVYTPKSDNKGESGISWNVEVAISLSFSADSDLFKVSCCVLLVVFLCLLEDFLSLGGSDNLHLLGYSSFGGLEFSITGLFLYQRCWYTGNSH